MKNWHMFLLYVPWCSPFVILLKKSGVEFAIPDNGVAVRPCYSEFLHLFLNKTIILTGKKLLKTFLIENIVISI